jgi:hypothetical protein
MLQTLSFASAASRPTSGRPQLIGKPLEQAREGDAQLLCVLVKVCSRPRAARETDLLRPHIGVGKVAWHFALCAPEIDLERERVSIVTASPSATVHRNLIIELAARGKLPAVYFARYFVIAGGLISYGPDFADQFRRAAGSALLLALTVSARMYALPPIL